MKTDRLLGIIALLQQNKSVTAPALAEKFEVSRRTINRDIEDICRAGIPLVTRQGRGGGISIMEGFHLDTTVFTEEELQSVFAGLTSIDSVSSTSYSARLSNKLAGNDSVIPHAPSMRIDLSSFYKDSLSNKIELLQKAIAGNELVRFRYYYRKGEAEKLVEPYQIVFQWAAWYLFGFCRQRQDFRLYKLNRLWDLELCGSTFTRREIPQAKQDFGANMADDYMVAAIYHPTVKYRLVEEYGPGSYQTLDSGLLHARWGFANAETALLWFLGFGDMVEVVDPPGLRKAIKETTKKILERYAET